VLCPNLPGKRGCSTRQVGLLILGTEAWVGVYQVEERGVGPEHKSPLCRWSPVCEGRREEATYLYGFAAVQILNMRNEAEKLGYGQILIGLCSFLWSRFIW